MAHPALSGGGSHKKGHYYSSLQSNESIDNHTLSKRAQNTKTIRRLALCAFMTSRIYAHCSMNHCFTSFAMQLHESFYRCRIEQQIRNLSCVVKTRRIRSIPSASATLRRLYNYTISIFPPRQRISVALQRGNAFCVPTTLKNNNIDIIFGILQY